MLCAVGDTLGSASPLAGRYVRGLRGDLYFPKQVSGGQVRSWTVLELVKGAVFGQPNPTLSQYCWWSTIRRLTYVSTPIQDALGYLTSICQSRRVWLSQLALCPVFQSPVNIFAGLVKQTSMCPKHRPTCMYSLGWEIQLFRLHCL